MKFETTKNNQTKLIEQICGKPQLWFKLAMYNIVMNPSEKYGQHFNAPAIDCETIGFSVRSAEHPEGYPLSQSDSVIRRICRGFFVRKSDGGLDAFHWKAEKVKRMIDNNEHFDVAICPDLQAFGNFKKIVNELLSVDEQMQFTELVAFHTSLLVVVTPEEEKYGVEVTQELLDVLPSILESYNNENDSARVVINVGDLLVRDGPEGSPYYVVERFVKESTYRKD